MFQKSGLIKTVSRLVLAAFLYSFVIFEPLYGLTTLEGDAKANAATRAALEQQLCKLVLPAQQGRISDGCYVASGHEVPLFAKEGVGGVRGSKKLVIFIQDLHCNPEVQKNISSILSFFDTKYGLKKIFVEGAPVGKTDLSLFTGITDPAIKDKTLDALLNEGLLSGVVYYGAKNNKENLQGLENWNLYKENASRMSTLLSSKSTSSNCCAEIASLVEETSALYASNKFRAASDTFAAAEKSKDRYSKFAKLAEKAGISLLQYPTLKDR
jgi:hypothetical protein